MIQFGAWSNHTADRPSYALIACQRPPSPGIADTCPTPSLPISGELCMPRRRSSPLSIVTEQQLIKAARTLESLRNPWDLGGRVWGLSTQSAMSSGWVGLCLTRTQEAGSRSAVLSAGQCPTITVWVALAHLSQVQGTLLGHTASRVGVTHCA